MSQISGFDALPRYSLAPLRARDIKRRIKRESAGRERTGLRAPLFPASPSPLSQPSVFSRLHSSNESVLRTHAQNPPRATLCQHSFDKLTCSPVCVRVRARPCACVQTYGCADVFCGGMRV